MKDILAFPDPDSGPWCIRSEIINDNSGSIAIMVSVGRVNRNRLYSTFIYAPVRSAAHHAEVTTDEIVKETRKLSIPFPDESVLADWLEIRIKQLFLFRIQKQVNMVLNQDPSISMDDIYDIIGGILVEKIMKS